MVPMSVPKSLRHLGPVFRSGEAVAAGVSWRDLYALRDAGQIIELSRGLFQLADQSLEHVDFVAVCGRVPDGMICLDSALAYWDLTDEIPRKVHVAVPAGLIGR
jgi:predicted transcriptional regulator of viral defense system